jgi:alkaline phosphatase D
MRNTLLLFISFIISSVALAQNGIIQSGPMVGYSEMKEVAIWLQTKKPAKVKIKYWETANPKMVFETFEQIADPYHGFTAHLIADKVDEGKQYTYEVWIDGKKVNIPYELSFQTQKLWAWRTDPPAFKLALGSCNYVADSAYDRPGKPYGGDYEIFKSIRAKDPDLMLWLGDNTYLREADWGTQTGINYRYTHSRSIPELQELLGSTHHYAIWDDHDYGPNDADRSFINKQLTLQAFKDFWANPNYNATGQGGITGTFVWNDAQFFLMDDRWFRTSNKRITGTKEMLGKAQIEWLIDALKYSPATFKFIAVGNQVLSDLAQYENMAMYAEERAALIKAITDEQIPGVIFLTGDRHQTELTQLNREGTYPLRDLTVSPLTSSANSKTKDEKNTLRVADTFIGERNFAILEFTGKRKERVLTIVIYDTFGKEVWRKSINETELK